MPDAAGGASAAGASRPSSIAFEKALKSALTIVVVSAVVSPRAGWVAYMFLGLAAIKFKRLFCLRAQPLRVQFFVSMYFISCCFVVPHLFICWKPDEDAACTSAFLGLLPLFMYYYFVFTDCTAFHSMFAPGTDLLLTHVQRGFDGAYIVHSNKELHDRQLACLESHFGSPDSLYRGRHEPLMLRAVQFFAQKDGTCVPWVSDDVLPRKGETVKFTYANQSYWRDADWVLSERPLVCVVLLVAQNMWLAAFTANTFAFFVLVFWWSNSDPRCRFLDQLVDAAIHKACATIRGLLEPALIESRKILDSWTGGVARGARGCVKSAWSWASWAAPKMLRWCAHAALACAAMALGVCTGAAMYAASFALVMHPVMFVVRAVEAWRNLDEPSRSCFCRAALFMAVQRLVCVRAVRCGVVAAVSGGVVLLQAAVQTLQLSVGGIVSRVAALAADLVAIAIALAVGAVLTLAVLARALVLSVKAAARVFVAGLHKSKPVETRAPQYTHPRCDLDSAQCGDPNVDDVVAGGDSVVETTESRPSSADVRQVSTAKRFKYYGPEVHARAKKLYEIDRARSRMSNAADEAEGERPRPATEVTRKKQSRSGLCQSRPQTTQEGLTANLLGGIVTARGTSSSKTLPSAPEPRRRSSRLLAKR